MQARYKWLLLPPAIAVVLLMGPLRQTVSPTSTPAPQAESEASPVGKGIVPMPDAWQVTSSLFGILLLGVAGIMLLARIRKGPAARVGDLMSLRQSLRLSNRHRLHAVQFDDNILLLGESEGRLNLLRLGRDPEQIEDDEELGSRDAEDGGAVPRDMIIPRPPASSVRRTSPTGATERARPSVDDFKELLRSVKAGARR